jgi:hypothetical protein
MNFKQKSKTSILNLNNASIFIYRGHPLHYALYLLLLSPFIYSFSPRVFITHRDFTTLSLYLRGGLHSCCRDRRGSKYFPQEECCYPSLLGKEHERDGV